MAEPEDVVAEIAKTRAELGGALDELAEKVTGARTVGRHVDAIKEKVLGDSIKEKGLVAAERGAGWNVKEAAVGQSQDSARVSAARALIVVRRRTGKPIPAEVFELAGTGWE